MIEWLLLFDSESGEFNFVEILLFLDGPFAVLVVLVVLVRTHFGLVLIAALVRELRRRVSLLAALLTMLRFGRFLLVR